MKKLTIISGKTGAGKTRKLNALLAENKDAVYFVNPHKEQVSRKSSVGSFSSLDEVQSFIERNNIETNDKSLFIDEFSLLKSDSIVELSSNFKEVVISKQGAFDSGLDLLREFRAKGNLEKTEIQLIEVKRNN